MAISAQEKAFLEASEALEEATKINRRVRAWQGGENNERRAALCLTAIDQAVIGWSGNVVACGNDANLLTLLCSILRNSARMRYLLRTALEVVDMDRTTKGGGR
jgi:hypothetical protein